jgi:hypothetical protein
VDSSRCSRQGPGVEVGGVRFAVPPLLRCSLFPNASLLIVVRRLSQDFWAAKEADEAPQAAPSAAAAVRAPAAVSVKDPNEFFRRTLLKSPAEL